jgi:hypothetical protein
MATKQPPLTTIEKIMIALTIAAAGYTAYNYFFKEDTTTGNNTLPSPPPPSGTSACTTWSGTIPTVAQLTAIRTMTGAQAAEALDFLPAAQKPNIRLCSAGIHIAYLQRLYNLAKNANIQVDGKCGPITKAAFNIATGEKSVAEIYAYL